QVGRFRLLATQASRPVEQERRVQIDEPRPGLVLARLPQALQQAGRGFHWGVFSASSRAQAGTPSSACPTLYSISARLSTVEASRSAANSLSPALRCPAKAGCWYSIC